jgi:DNA-binding transcriptional regulator YiaG
MTVTVNELLDRARAYQALPSLEERRRIREAAGASQADLASVMGVSQATVDRWEKGTACPRGRHARSYADLLEALREVIEA